MQAVLELLGVPFVGTPARLAGGPGTSRRRRPSSPAPDSHTPDWVALPHTTFRALGAQAVLDAMVGRLGLPLMLKPDQGGSALGAQVVGRGRASCRPRWSAASRTRTPCWPSGSSPAPRWRSRSSRTDGEPRALPPVEVEAKGGVYDYTARYTPGATTFHCPARLDARRRPALAETRARGAPLLGLRDVSRMDAVVDAAGRVQILEVNVSPGLTDTSLLPTAAAAAGLDLGLLYAGLVERAIARVSRETPGAARISAWFRAK